MKMETLDLVQGFFEKNASLFPNCVTEAVDEERRRPERMVYNKVWNEKQLNKPEQLNSELKS